MIKLMLLLMLLLVRSAQADITTGLALYWQMAEGSGTALNNTGVANVAGNTGLIQTAGGNIPTWVSGASCYQQGSCLSFDGSQGRVLTTDPGVVAGATFTLAAWVWNSSVNGAALAIVIRDANNGTCLCMWQVNDANRNKLNMAWSGGNHFGTSLIPTDTWVHIAWASNAGTSTAYINGVAAGTSSPVPSGTGFYEFGTSVTGRIDEVRVYSRALSASDIQELVGKRPKRVVEY